MGISPLSGTIALGNLPVEQGPENDNESAENANSSSFWKLLLIPYYFLCASVDTT